MKYIPLVQVCDFQGGSQPPKDQWIDYEQEGYIRMLQIRDFTQPDKDNVEFVRISKTIKTCNEDDILIGRYGASVGKILTGLAGAYNVAIIKTIPDTSKLSKRFLYHYLNSPYFQNFILSVGSRAAQAGFNKDDLSDAQIPDLSLEEQSNVVLQLDKVTELIALRKEQLAKLDQLVKSRFIELFGDPIGNPMKWEKMKLGDVCTKLTDGTHFSPESYPEGEYRYVTAKNIKLDGFDFSNITYVPKSVHEEIYARCNPEYGDVLYIKDGVTTGIAMVNTLHEPFTMLSSVALLKQNRKLLEGAYLCGVLNNQNMYDTIRKDMGGAAITRLTIVKLKNIQIPVPPLELQTQFAAFVEQTDKSKLAIQQSLNKLELLKKSLMQKYFG